MDVIEAIKSRYSVRSFKPDPVPRSVLEELLTVSQFAPSWANTQTWEFAVVGGEVMKHLCSTLSARNIRQDERTPDVKQPEWEEPFLSRRSENASRLYEQIGIRRDDREARLDWFAQMYDFFGAPNAIFIYTEKHITTWAILNIGLVAQTISLAALNYGLGTVMLAAGICYPDTVRSILHIPDAKQIVISMAIGYPDPDARVNQFRSGRVPLSEICTWHGFE